MNTLKKLFKKEFGKKSNFRIITKGDFVLIAVYGVPCSKAYDVDDFILNELQSKIGEKPYSIYFCKSKRR